MSRDKYSDDYTVELISADKIFTIDSPNITFSSNSDNWNSNFSDDGVGNGITSNITFDGATVFHGYVGLNNNLYAEGNAYLRGAKVHIGAQYFDSISEISLNPEGGDSGEPVVVNGNLEITGSIKYGSLDFESVSLASDDTIYVTANGVGSDVNISADDKILLNAGDDIKFCTPENIYLYSAYCLTGNTEDYSLISIGDGGIVLSAQTDDLSVVFMMNKPDHARFYFQSDNDWARREDYVVHIGNPDAAGRHRVLLLTIGEADPDHGAQDGATESGTSADYFLVCKSGITAGDDDDGSWVYYINGDGSTSTGLTGQHWVVYSSEAISIIPDVNSYGMIVESSGEIFNNASISEALPVVQMCNEEKNSKVYGVLCPAKSGYDMRQFLQFSKPYNDACKGSIPEESDPSNYSSSSQYYKARVNSIGEGQVWVTNYNGEVSNGDYITSSEIAGYGMRQDDDILHSYTVAKCVEDIDWASVVDIAEHDGVEHKRYLSACTYHCG